jgi:hypothetical protein
MLLMLPLLDDRGDENPAAALLLGGIADCRVEQLGVSRRSTKVSL